MRRASSAASPVSPSKSAAEWAEEAQRIKIGFVVAPAANASKMRSVRAIRLWPRRCPLGFFLPSAA